VNRILALDTTHEYGSLALAEGGQVVAEALLHSNEGFSRVLFGELRGLLERSGWELADIDCFAAAAGPGSFTGVRVGLAAAKGLSEALGKPVVAVSNLQALAWYGEAALRAAVVDARREQVYGALYTAELEFDGRRGGGSVPRVDRDTAGGRIRVCLPGWRVDARTARGNAVRAGGGGRSAARAGGGDCADCGGAAPGWRSAGPGGGRRQLREAVGCGVVLAHAIMGRGEDTVKALAYIGLIFGALVYGAGPGYHVVSRIPIGGEGFWDYLTVDSGAGGCTFPMARMWWWSISTRRR